MAYSFSLQQACKFTGQFSTLKGRSQWVYKQMADAFLRATDQIYGYQFLVEIHLIKCLNLLLNLIPNLQQISEKSLLLRNLLSVQIITLGINKKA
jgi:hypothetical protein